jgi:hypothetical protein
MSPTEVVPMRAIRTVKDLVGEQVNGVCFVMDYLELSFNGPILRALTNAVLDTPSQRFTFPDPGLRDALCSLIGATVVDVSVDDDRSIQLRFDSQQLFTIPLDRASRTGVEAAHFVTGLAQPIAVW